jgi:phenylpropionate dioxygenase-like ring-hydroxylating dioxygenase large terminal subunit
VQARTPPASWYTGAAALAEQRAVFHNNWLMAGSPADLERREGGRQDNFYTLSLAGMPLLVARGSDGRLRAFHNARTRSVC